ncbi:MAG: homoserine O-succinyltransferase [Lachnospiraceae bacterium]|nr:homoserine O-succinyltransferase [Lachnospiraceae bacterium]
MPIKVPNHLPARETLEAENIFVMDENRAMSQDIRPLRICILNLMPIKQDYETQLLRALSNSPLQVEMTFLNVVSHESKNTSASHLNQFYTDLSSVKDQHFDGMIITGAPVEKLDFEEVEYWEEITQMIDWSRTHVTSVMYICWGALAGLYYLHGIEKEPLERKLSGIYRHRVLDRRIPLVRSFDDVFDAPHSRYFGVKREDIEKDPSLVLLAESREAGPYLVCSKDGREVYVLGHPEYDRMTLDMEYHRDLGKGLNPDIPEHYYEQDDPRITPLLTWRGHANTLYSNWLNFYVYQETPYEWDEA